MRIFRSPPVTGAVSLIRASHPAGADERAAHPYPAFAASHGVGTSGSNFRELGRMVRLYQTVERGANARLNPNPEQNPQPVLFASDPASFPWWTSHP